MFLRLLSVYCHAWSKTKSLCIQTLCAVFHTHGCMGKQHSCRRECSSGMSDEATVWHDPINNRCSHTHAGKSMHDETRPYLLWLTEAKRHPHSITNAHNTCAKCDLALTVASTYATICLTVESREKNEIPILEMAFLFGFLSGSILFRSRATAVKIDRDLALVS